MARYKPFMLVKGHGDPLARYKQFTLAKGQIDTLPPSLQNECAAMPIFQGEGCLGEYIPQTIPFSVHCLNHFHLRCVSFSGGC